MDENTRDRLDSKLSITVNKGLAAMYLNGLSAGIKIMRAGGVPADIADRVLLKPHCRRETDWKR